MRVYVYVHVHVCRSCHLMMSLLHQCIELRVPCVKALESCLTSLMSSKVVYCLGVIATTSGRTTLLRRGKEKEMNNVRSRNKQVKMS